MTVWYAGRNKHIKKICAPSWFCLQHSLICCKDSNIKVLNGLYSDSRAVVCPHCLLRNDPKERSSQILRGVSLKSRIITHSMSAHWRTSDRLLSTEMRTHLKYNLLIGTMADLLCNLRFHKIKEFFEICE